MQTLIWGMTLGPGFMTRNPYAGIWLLPVFLTLHHNLLINVAIGLIIGITHGTARAFGVIYTHRNLDTCGLSILTQWRWRIVDGLMLLLVAGYLTTYVLPMLQLLSR
ncbi:MAG: hypothetical protein M3Z24_03550 [Chloroflexota bacterium]|nr:hypothetical protein [Chloroflexota bacterium]